MLNTHPVAVQDHTPEDLNTGSCQFVTVCVMTIQNIKKNQRNQNINTTIKI
jgi:hypothetical protein